MTLAIDIGGLAVKVAAVEVATDQGVSTLAAPSGGEREAIRAALAAARPTGRSPGQPTGPLSGRLCVAVPEAWLSGTEAGARRQEAVRHECEDVAETGQVTWVGQLAAVAALAARERGRPGRYLVCDLGGTGVRAGLFSVSVDTGSSEPAPSETGPGGIRPGETGPGQSGLGGATASGPILGSIGSASSGPVPGSGQPMSSGSASSETAPGQAAPGQPASAQAASGLTVEVLAHHAAEGGGWREFDSAVRAGLPEREAAALPRAWYEQAASGRQARRAALVLQDATEEPEEFGDTRVYTICGSRGDISLTAGYLIDAFAPTRRSLKAAIEAVSRGPGSPSPSGSGSSSGTASGGQPPDSVVLTGGLGWFPLAARAVTDWTGIAPETTDSGAAARGGLLFARGEARLAPPAECPVVTVPASRVHDGLLQEVDVPLPWTAPFAPVPGGALTIDTDRLDLAVDGRSRVARLPGLAPGPHRIGLRPAWPGPGVLVVRSVAAEAVHLVPLAGL